MKFIVNNHHAQKKGGDSPFNLTEALRKHTHRCRGSAKRGAHIQWLWKSQGIIEQINILKGKERYEFGDWRKMKTLIIEKMGPSTELEIHDNTAHRQNQPFSHSSNNQDV